MSLDMLDGFQEIPIDDTKENPNDLPPPKTSPTPPTLTERMTQLETNIRTQTTTIQQKAAERNTAKETLLEATTGSETFAARLAQRAVTDPTPVGKGAINILGSSFGGAIGGGKGLVLGAVLGFVVICTLNVLTGGSLPVEAYTGAVVVGAFTGAALLGKEGAKNGPKVLEQGLNTVLLKLASATAGKDEKLSGALETLQEKEESLSTEEKKLDTLTKDQVKLSRRQQDVDVLKTDLSRYNQQLSTLESKMNSHSLLDEVDRPEIESSITRVKAQITSINKEIERLENLK